MIFMASTPYEHGLVKSPTPFLPDTARTSGHHGEALAMSNCEHQAMDADSRFEIASRSDKRREQVQTTECCAGDTLVLDQVSTPSWIRGSRVTVEVFIYPPYLVFITYFALLRFVRCRF